MRQPAISLPPLLTNSFCSVFEFSEAIRTCLSFEILPPRSNFPRKFPKQDGFKNRYHGEREHYDPLLKEKDLKEHSYEELLEQFFWKDLNADEDTIEEPELYITGAVGSGKSTFVDYYLRYYCPEKGKWRQEFDRKLVVYFDARGLENQNYASQAFYSRLHNALKVHCKEHNLSIPKSRDSGSRATDELIALSEFCKDSPHFKYLVLVLDNLDNCTVSVQRQVIQYVTDIRRFSGLKVWKVIIPLWPTTYSTFAESTEALTAGKPRIHIGPPTKSVFIKKRLSFIKESIIGRTKVPLEHSDGSAYEKSQDFSNYIDFVFDKLQTPKFAKLVRDLCNDDLRRELWLWEGVLRSPATEDIFRSKPAESPSEYEWMEALIAGDMRTRPSSGERRIANLFAMQYVSHTPHDLLAGFHGCYLLKKTHSRRGWYIEMMKLGYTDLQLDGLENSFRKFNILHPIPEKFTGEDFEVHNRTVDAYLDIVTHEAYIDNMSMITPVDPETKGRIKLTSGHMIRDVLDRVSSSIAFIEFLHLQEREFVKNLTRPPVSLSDGMVKGAKAKNEQFVPSIAGQVASNYLRRVKAIRNVLQSGSKQFWDDCEERCSKVQENARSLFG
jgi:hypothetical protein